MERRTFLKNTSLAGLFTLITPGSIIHSFSHASINVFPIEDFINPSRKYAPHTWWHWMNGNVSKEGISLDLEAMKEIGLGGFQLFDAGTGILKGSIEYLSDSWFELMKHTIAESQRLGLEFAMHNCPGWSSSGGPWITPELSMQQLVWSETAVKGGETATIKLPQPLTLMDFYKDSKVIAFPAKGVEAKTFKDLVKTAKINGENIEIDLLDGYSREGLTVKPHGKEYAVLEVEFFTPSSLSGLVMFSSKLNEIPSNSEVFFAEVSNDGKTFYKVADFKGGNNDFNSDGDAPAYINFDKRDVSFVRIITGSARHYCNLQFRDTHQSHNWLSKAYFRGAGWSKEPLVTNSSSDYISSDTVLDITQYLDQNGILKWKAPKGNWKIIRLGHTTIKQYNHSAPTTGTGLECDKFSKDALDFHFSKMFDKLLPQFKAMSKDAKVGLLIDSYEMNDQNWSPKLAEEFERIRNYSIINYLPALTGRLVNSTEETSKFLWDFKRTCSDLMAENYYEHFNTLCRNNGIESYTEPYGGQFEEMQVGSKIGNNMGEFWVGLTGLWDNSGMRRTIKLASSIANTNGQKIVGAEAYTSEPGSGKWQQHPYSMKALGDWMYTLGLNRIIFHRYAHQPHPTAAPGMTMGPWGIHFERTNTWWKQGKAWIKYQTRIQSILQKGTFQADVVYLASEEPGYSLRTMRGQLSYELPYGYDYDFMSPESLMKAKISNGEIVLEHGMKYKVMVLTGGENMVLARLVQIEKLLRDGLILVGRKPTNNPGMEVNKDDKGLFEDLTNRIWGTDEFIVSKDYGKGRIYVSTSLEKVFQDLNIRPDFHFTSASGDAPINYIHKKNKDEDYYFLANKRRTNEQLVCSFRIKEKLPEFWDPDTGESVDASIYIIEKDHVKVYLDMSPSGSLFVVFRKNSLRPGIKSIYKDNQLILDTSDYPAVKPILFEDTVNNFSVSVWVKPEVDIFLGKEEFFGPTKTDYYAIFPFQGEKLFGKGHALIGLTAGRNGIVVFERESQEINDVLFVKKALSGWTNIVVEYLNGAPRLHINGILEGEGKSSSRTIHHGIGLWIEDQNVSFYNGDISKPIVLNSPITDEKLKSILEKGPFNKDIMDYNSTISQKRDTISFNQNGFYRTTDQAGSEKSFKIEGAGEIMNLDTDWKVGFPPKLGAPESIDLPRLSSLHKHKIDGVKYFSGTALYGKEFDLKNFKVQENQKIILELGKVEVMAEVLLNQKSLGTIWKPPYRIDITENLRQGLNTLEIKVTNLWPNRLIGDEQLQVENKYLVAERTNKFAVLGIGGIQEMPLWYKNGLEKPEGGRIAFSTWQHYQKESPLLESGLIGPVRLFSEVFVKV